MTRINMSFPPSLLSNKHLIAEWKELLRMPRFALKHTERPKDLPERFTLVTGHMKSCLPYMAYLHKRQILLGEEMESRGYYPDTILRHDTWKSWLFNSPDWQWTDYQENDKDFNIVLERLKERDSEFYRDFEYR